MDRDVGKAVAAWQQFTAHVDDELLRAVSGAFALVACADGDVDDAEVERFASVVHETPAFAGVDTLALETHFRDLAAAIVDDFDAGRALALAAVAAARHHREARLIVRAAQIAIVADDQLHDQEEDALVDVCSALGLDPADY